MKFNIKDVRSRAGLRLAVKRLIKVNASTPKHLLILRKKIVRQLAEKHLVVVLLTRPDKILPVITHLAGSEVRFPSQFLTKKPVKQVKEEYEWKKKH